MNKLCILWRQLYICKSFCLNWRSSPNNLSDIRALTYGICFHRNLFSSMEIKFISKSSPDVSGSSTQCCGDTNKMSSRKQLFYLFEGHYNHRVQVLYTICFARIIHSFLARFLYLYVYYIYIISYTAVYTNNTCMHIIFRIHAHTCWLELQYYVYLHVFTKSTPIVLS